MLLLKYFELYSKYRRMEVLLVSDFYLPFVNIKLDLYLYHILINGIGINQGNSVSCPRGKYLDGYIDKRGIL